MGKNVLEPRLARIWIRTLSARQPQRDVIPLDHTTERCYCVDNEVTVR